MFQLLQPIWLFALAAISAPIIIHLWNRRPGKILKVGSVLLVKENILSYKRRIKLSELLLLLLRCLLLVCIVFALAGPLWISIEKNKSKGWVLINKQNLSATYNHFKPFIDSLLQTGMEFHYFEDGFKKDKLDNALHLKDTGTTEKISYRGIVSLLNEQVDSKLPVYIFTDNYLRNFNGNRNEVSLNLHWQTYTPDTATTKIFADTNALQITILSHLYKNDAHYLQAAIEAIKQFSKKNIEVRFINTSQDIPAKQDWLFCLDDSMPANIKEAKNVLVYAKGETIKRVSYILPDNKNVFAAVNLYKSVAEKGTEKKYADKEWQDGFGEPLLLVQHKNKTTWYYLYTHFDPAWNELPWSGNFPAIIYKLLYANQNHELLNDLTDKTIISKSQLIPAVINSKPAAFNPDVIETKLADIFWLMAFILFFAERSVSFYQRKKNENG